MEQEFLWAFNEWNFPAMGAKMTAIAGIDTATFLSGTQYLLNCSFMIMSDQSITWQQVNAFRQEDMIKTTCWSSKRASEFGRKAIWVNVAWLLVPHRRVWVFQETAPPGQNALLMPEVREQMRGQRGNSDSNNYSLQPRSAEDNLWTHERLKMGSGSNRGLHWVPIWLPKNRKLRHGLTQIGHKMLQRHLDGRFWTQISIQSSTFGMWWKRRFVSWMHSRQICGNCVTLSCQHGECI